MHEKAKKGQRLYKPGNWRMMNKDQHLSGCPSLTKAIKEGHYILASG